MKFIIADAPFTVDNGQMTPTLKVRRHIVQDVYANKIDNLYKR
jgi:long-chain acyl-CoA synthetase